MSNLDDHKQNQQHQEYFPPTVATAPPVADVEINVSKSPPAGTTTTHVATAAPVTVVEKKSPDTMFGVSEIVQRRKIEEEPRYDVQFLWISIYRREYGAEEMSHILI
jgi:hypothetical protein